MDVVFEGALSKSWSMADVLRDIMGVENLPYAILRLSSPGANISGRLAVADSAFVVGAILSDGDSGYSAVRRLLLATDGNFAYLETDGKRPGDLEQGLYISLEKLSGLWPDLPLDASDLFDEKSLLDKVFGAEGLAPDHHQSGQIPIYPSGTPLDSGELPVIGAPPALDKQEALVKSLQAAASSGTAPAPSPAWQTAIRPLLARHGADDNDQSVSGPYLDLANGVSQSEPNATRSRAHDGQNFYTSLMRRGQGSMQAIIFIVALILVVSLMTFFASTAITR